MLFTKTCYCSIQESPIYGPAQLDYLVLKHRKRGWVINIGLNGKDILIQKILGEPELNLIPNAHDALNNYKIKNNITAFQY
jgi:hypothetical protein